MYTQKNLSEILRSFSNDIAIEENGKFVSYSELVDKSAKISAFLLNRGAQPQSRIGICADDITDMVAVILGVIQARCVFVPLDTSLPEKRISSIIKESGLDVIITSNGNSLRLKPGASTCLVALADILEKSGSEISHFPDYSEDDELYVYFTSGSTGLPKGIVGKNSSLWHFLEWEIATFEIKAGERFSQFISPYFDAFLRDIFVPLITGGTICVPARENGVFTLDKLAQWIDEQHISFIHCVPSVFRLFNSRGLTQENFEKLKYVLLSGERIIPGELKNWYDTFQNRIQLVNLYGATEATMISSYHKIEQQDTLKAKIPIGKPISDTELIVLDNNLEPSRLLNSGDLYIVSEFLSKGYLNNSSLTAERFVTLRQGTDYERFAFKTGDTARVLPDGSIDLLGRGDRLIKLRGIRIELDEIERILAQCEWIENAIVLYDEKLDSLAAFVIGNVHNIKADTTEDLVEKYAQEYLPHYMIPSRIIAVESFPLLSNGKVDHKQLLLRSKKQVVLKPCGVTEEKVAAIWKEILNINEISVDSKFHHVGGNSLSIMRLIPRFFSEFGIRLTLAELFLNLTIQQQAKLIDNKIAASQLDDEAETATEDRIIGSIPRAPGRPYYALSSSQKRLFFLNQLSNTSLAYNMPYTAILEGELHRDKLERVIKELIAQHESLRTSIHIVGEQAVQKVWDEVTFSLQYFESSDDQAQSLIKDFIRPFDLETAPLFRVGIVRLSNNRHLLLFDIHHIIADGISHEILASDFMKLYNGEALPMPGLQYKDFSEWQQDREQQALLSAQRYFWKQEFAGDLNSLELPTDFPRPFVKSYGGNNRSFSLSKEDTFKIKEMAEQAGATMFMTVLTLFNILLSKLSNQEDIIIGTALAGRYHASLQRTIGMFVNTLALRNYPKHEMSFREFLSQVKTKTLSCFENQSFPYEELIEEVRLARDTSRNPLFDVMFLFQNFGQHELTIPGLKLKPYDSDHNVSKFDLTLSAGELNGELHLNFEYATDLFRAETIDRFIVYLRKIVAEVTRNPDIHLSDIDLLPEAERAQLLYSFNDTKVEYQRDKTVVDLFQEQAAKNPDNIALVFDNYGMSYRELELRSNALAYHLIENGVGNRDIVAIISDRSFELVVGIYAIMKAGAAYLPIDPAYPPQRVNYILSDSNARLLLTKPKYKEKFADNIEVIEFSTAAELPEQSITFDNPSNPDDLAYVIYTSGSTGKPKGVMIPHSAVSNLAKAAENILSFENKVIISVTTFTFDIFVFESLLPLLYGATVVLASENEQRDPAALSRVIQKHRVNIIQSTPSLIKTIVESPDSWDGLQQLTDIIVGGEPFSPLLFEALKQKSNARIFNMYGPTEATVWSTFTELNCRENITIGKPIGNTQVYIVNKENQLQPIGVVGELCISGDGLSKGYINNEELTLERFVDHPFGDREKLYKTGDIARWLPDGNIQFFGRIDHQVKIRGFRIELGEIESLLAGYNGIKDVVVTARESTDDNFLVVYYVSDDELSSSALQDYLALHLPAYMLPAHYVHLSVIPLTTNGKVDRKALPAPDFKKSHDYIAASNEMEELMVQIWSEVLRIDKEAISTNRNFFDLGGNSLKLVSLANKMKHAFNTEVSVASLFNAPTITALTLMLNHSQKASSAITNSRIDEEMEVRDEILNLLERN